MSKVQMLDASVDTEDISDIRILVDHKYGRWNTAHISSDPSTGTPYFASATNKTLPAVTELWHPLFIEFLGFQMGKKLRSNVHEATCSQLNGKVVIKLAEFHWEMQWLNQETQAYQWIKDLNVGPKFLAHLTEEGRVIGFAMEHIQDARHAEPIDITLRQQALQRLHGSGIKHGDVNKHNILIRDDRATLIDFDNAARNQEASVLDAELNSLEAVLADQSGRGGIIVGTVDDSDL
ncbi:alpha-galactosidase A precursor [Aureobasidium subglaciale]|nr:alpha-galactosidase A precursor [Aureobasidium subglaciale]KAI5214547.1 alpha-galactosidase A precursor [Aureobasidium subglaciale]KAI5217274.1 alpha-galactosidase A precursor [Aureobasidium subglaciale]KAI5251041.1 alpha-galactosidase A precursor [Aureobasidium subglaciale]KAI5255016.1 alpha-galactosidase A precursor [Aureobasidium subglaciale]